MHCQSSLSMHSWVRMLGCSWSFDHWLRTWLLQQHFVVAWWSKLCSVLSKWCCLCYRSPEYRSHTKYPQPFTVVHLLLLSLAFTISNFVSAARWRPHHVLGVVLRCRRRSKSTGTRSQYASLFGVHRSRRVARRCNPTHACCCGMVTRLIGTSLAGSIGHGAGPFPVAGW